MKFENQIRKWLVLSKYIRLTIGSFFIICFLKPVHAQENTEHIDNLRSKIQEVVIKDLVILSTVLIEASEDAKRHILVRGYTMPSNYFNIRLPVDNWNGKGFVSGCGAGCGTLPIEVSGRIKIALNRGYATATMNTGHWSPNQFDFSWAYNNPQAETDYAHRAVHETKRVLDEIIQVFYERESIHSYFWGCSGGGRQAVMATVEYPDDFDGVIAQSPALSYTESLMLLAWMRQVNTGSNGRDILTKEDVPLIKKAVYGACDGLDGKIDGLISNPTKCEFDTEVLLCKNNKECLSDEKVEVLKKWYQGPVNSKGKRLLTTGVALGSEPFWRLWLLGETNEIYNELLNSENMLKYTAFQEDPGRDYTVFDFDFDKDPDKMEYMANLLNVTNRSLSPFKNKGGKILIYHGADDPAIPYQMSIDYYNEIYEDHGNQTENFLKLFLIPGMDHCTALQNLGITEKSVDPLTTLEKWVEGNKAPTELSVTRFNKDGSVNSKFMVPQYKRN